MDLPLRRAAHRARIGYLTASFDRFHIGHIALLREARAACDHLVVGVLTDEHLSAEGHPAAWHAEDRLTAVRSCRFVDEALLQHGDDPRSVWSATGFDIAFVDTVTRDTYPALALEDRFRSLGAEVVYLTFPVDDAQHAPISVARRAG